MRADLPPSVTASWLIQNGRSRYQRAIAADGIQPRHPFAGLVAVAEALPGDERSAALAVSTLRDIFGEGIAYGVGEALYDAVEEASERIRDAGLQGCSMAAAAFLGDRVWTAHRGNCRIYTVSEEGTRQVCEEHTLAVQMGLGSQSPGFTERSRDLTAHLGERRATPDTAQLSMSPGQSVLLLTAGAWLELGSDAIAEGGCGGEGLARLSGRAKLRFRRQGGALASICFRRARRWRLGKRRILGALPFLMAAGAIAALVYLMVRLFSCGGSEPPTQGVDTTEVIMPLEVPEHDTLVAELAGPSLPVPVLVLSDDSLALGPDSFTQTVAGYPDPQWERFETSIYRLESDSLLDSLAGILARSAAIDTTRLVRRIVVVRDDGVAAFSRWLPELAPGQAESTAVIVESGSSVAGGAAWTERYPVFVNGDRDLEGEASAYIGAPLQGIPAIPDSSLYRFVVVPEPLD